MKNLFRCFSPAELLERHKDNSTVATAATWNTLEAFLRDNPSLEVVVEMEGEGSNNYSFFSPADLLQKLKHKKKEVERWK